MDVELVQTLRSHPFSPARRLFVLEEMLEHVSDDDRDLADRIEHLIELDRANVRRSTNTEDDRPLADLVDPPGADGQPRRRAHRQFIALIEEIAHQRLASASPSILLPVRRQTKRIRRVEHSAPPVSDDSPFPRPST